MKRTEFSAVALRLIAVSWIIFGGLFGVALYMEKGISESFQRATEQLDAGLGDHRSAELSPRPLTTGKIRTNAFLAVFHCTFGLLLFIAVPYGRPLLDFGLRGDFLPFHAVCILIRAGCIQACMTLLLQIAAFLVYGDLLLPDQTNVMTPKAVLGIFGLNGLLLVLGFILAHPLSRIVTIGMNGPNQAIEGTAR